MSNGTGRWDRLASRLRGTVGWEQLNDRSVTSRPMSEISNPTPTVEQLCAIEACREAARRYSYGLDRLDGNVMKSAYWPEAIDEHGRYNGNAWEFCDYCVKSHDKWTWTMHSIYNHRVEIDTDVLRHTSVRRGEPDARNVVRAVSGHLRVS